MKRDLQNHMIFQTKMREYKAIEFSKCCNLNSSQSTTSLMKSNNINMSKRGNSGESGDHGVRDDAGKGSAPFFRKDKERAEGFQHNGELWNNDGDQELFEFLFSS